MGKRRTKCFTGCWTCRSRRVKCDEKAPSCQRCEDIGLACEGYGLRLHWVHHNAHDAADDYQSGSRSNTPDKPQPRVSRRSLTSLGAVPPLPSLSSPELDATLTLIDDWRPGDLSNLEEGAFCVFQARPSAPLRPETGPRPHRLSSCQSEAVESPELPSGYVVLPEGVTSHPDIECISDSVEQSIHNLRESPPQSQTVSSLRGIRRPSVPRHIDAMPMPHKQKRLLHHWVTFTSRKIVLIDEPHNPCRTMMLPMALKGLMSPSDGSNADVAIFHALCAAAAYNLFELTGRTDEQDRVLALYHDNEAVHHLRHNLAQAAQHRDQSFAMAIMACIAVEAVSGTTQRWRTHVTGGLAYLAKLHSQGLDEITLSPFRQHMVKMAILCGISVSDDLKGFLQDESGSSDGLEFTFPYYGVSRSFLRAHDSINAIIAKGSQPVISGTDNELNAFELQLYLDFPSLPPPTQLSATADTTTGTVIHHTSKAFYYAGLVFFQRSVRYATVVEVQELVELGIQELECMDRVGQGKLGCLMLWPVLVLGAECGAPDGQRRMRAWFQSQRKLGFRNLIVLEDIISTVWLAREDPGADLTDADWRNVIAKAQFDVFRL